MLELIAGSIFISIALLTAALLYPLLSRREIVRTRLEQLMPFVGKRPELIPTPHSWQVFLAAMGSRLRMTKGEQSRYREMVTSAGFKPENVTVFLGSKLLLAAIFPALYIIPFALPSGNGFSGRTILVTFICAAGGYLLPSTWLRRRAESRKREIFHSLPDVLDLLTVCVESGLSLDAALVKTVDNFQEKKNPLIMEINQVTLEIRAGKVRAEALKGLAQRTMVDDVKSFVAMLVQTEKFGSSLGQTLRTYSDSMRTRRRQLAEEQAAKTQIKILFPLVFCIFPAMLVVVLVPAFYRISSYFLRH